MDAGSKQDFQRWFTAWPSTHTKAGQTVEVMPTAAVDRLRERLKQSEWIVCREALRILDDV